MVEGVRQDPASGAAQYSFSTSTGEGADTVAFNPDTMEAISAETAGTMTIIKENSPTNFTVADAANHARRKDDGA